MFCNNWFNPSIYFRDHIKRILKTSHNPRLGVMPLWFRRFFLFNEFSRRAFRFILITFFYAWLYSPIFLQLESIWNTKHWQWTFILRHAGQLLSADDGILICESLSKHLLCNRGIASPCTACPSSALFLQSAKSRNLRYWFSLSAASSGYVISTPLLQKRKGDSSNVESLRHLCRVKALSGLMWL